MATTYKCRYKNSDENLELKVRQFCEYYNSEIDFEDYYYKIYGTKLPYNGKDKCKLHDEVNGESFSYSKSSKIWSCWGSCKTTAAGIVEYHQKYLHKTRPFATIIDALNSLRKMYPQLPRFTYKPSNRAKKPSQSRLQLRVKKYFDDKKLTEFTPTAVDNKTDIDNSIRSGFQPNEALSDFNRLCLFAFTHNYIDRRDKFDN